MPRPSYTSALGISLSGVAEGSYIYCSIISQRNGARESHSFHELISPDLKSTVARIKSRISKDTTGMITVPVFVSENEKKEIFETFEELHIPLRSVINHAELFRLSIAEDRENGIYNELGLNVTSGQVGIELSLTDIEEGIYERKIIMSTTSSPSIHALVNGVQDAIDLLEAKPTVAGNRLHRLLITHLPTPAARQLVVDLKPVFPFLVSISSTTEVPELQAAQRAARDLDAPSRETFIFGITVLRVGIETDSSSVCTLLKKNITAPQSCSRIMACSAETATVKIIAGGPKYRVPLGEMKLTGVKTGQRVRVLLDIDEWMSGKVVVSDAERGLELGEMVINSLSGELKQKERDEAVTADSESEPDDLVSEGQLPA